MEPTTRLKLSLIFLLAATPVTTSIAQPSNCPACTFNGITIGVGAGASRFMNQTSSTTTIDSIVDGGGAGLAPSAPMPSNAFSDDASNRVSQYNGIGALFLGYGYTLDNHIYLGAEVGMNVLGANSTTMNQSASDTVTMIARDFENDFFGLGRYDNSLSTKTKVSRNVVEPFLDLKLGFLMTPTSLVYLRGGINYNTLEAKTTGSFLATGHNRSNFDDAPNTTVSVDDSFTIKHSNSELGYRAGIGMEVMVTPEIGVGGDYVYSFYQNVKASGSTSARNVFCDVFLGCGTVGATISSSSKITHISDQQVMAQMIYHFG